MSETLRFDIHLQQGNFRLQAQAALPLDACTAIVGTSGAGKTTLLRALGGFLPRDPKIIVQCGADTWQDAHRHLPPQRRPTACVFQDLRLFPHLSVGANLDYPLRRQPRAALTRARVVEMLQLEALLPRLPGSLSRGQQQRVAIGRALLSAARVLLLDEPLASLDGPARRRILDDLAHVRASTGVTLLLVSHAMSDVARLADRALVLDQGRVAGAGTLVELSADPALIDVLPERAAILEARAGAIDNDGVQHLHVGTAQLLAIDAGWPVGERLRLRIPADDVALALTAPVDTSVLNVLPGRVETLQTHGERVVAFVDIGEATVQAALSRRSVEALALEPGRRVWAMIKSVALGHANA